MAKEKTCARVGVLDKKTVLYSSLMVLVGLVAEISNDMLQELDIAAMKLVEL